MNIIHPCQTPAFFFFFVIGSTFIIRTKQNLFYKIDITLYLKNLDEISCITNLPILQKKTITQFTGSGYFLDSNNAFYYLDNEVINLNFKFNFYFSEKNLESKTSQVESDSQSYPKEDSGKVYPRDGSLPAEAQKIEWNYEIVKFTDLHQFGLLVIVVKNISIPNSNMQDLYKLLIYNTDKFQLSKEAEYNLNSPSSSENSTKNYAEKLATERKFHDTIFIDSGSLLLIEKLLNGRFKIFLLDIFGTSDKNLPTSKTQSNTCMSDAIESIKYDIDPEQTYKWIYTKNIEANHLRILTENSHLYVSKIDSVLNCISHDIDQCKIF